MYACEYGCGYLSLSYDQVEEHEHQFHGAVQQDSGVTHFSEYAVSSETQQQQQCGFCNFISTSAGQAQQHALQYHGVKHEHTPPQMQLPPPVRLRQSAYASVAMGSGGVSLPLPQGKLSDPFSVLKYTSNLEKDPYTLSYTAQLYCARFMYTFPG